MFSPSGTPPTGQPVAPGSHPTNLPPGSQQQLPMPASQGGQQRPGMPQPPPGKTAISRAIAPLISTSSQSQPRMGFNGNLPNQPSPKSKQKMSPRGGMANMGPGRPPGPKPQPGQMKGQGMPRMQSMTGPTSSPAPQGAPAGRRRRRRAECPPERPRLHRGRRRPRAPPRQASARTPNVGGVGVGVDDHGSGCSEASMGACGRDG